MHFTLAPTFALAATFLSTVLVQETYASGTHDTRLSLRSPGAHRRHHHAVALVDHKKRQSTSKSCPSKKRKRSCKSKSSRTGYGQVSASASASATSSASASSSTDDSSSSSTSSGNSTSASSSTDDSSSSSTSSGNSTSASSATDDSSSSSTSSGNSTSASSSTDDSSSSSTSSGNSTASSVVSSGDLSLPSGFLQKNGLAWGWLPDEADAGGSKQSMANLNSWTDSKSAFYGYYAQAKSGSTFDGSQLKSVMDDVKASGAIFQPAVMPTGGWQGLTESDNSQAVAIAKVMAEFTAEGIEVWLRFAHEVNWYQTDGTYSGNVDDFQEGWKVVSAAIDQYAPDVKMFFTPNVANQEQYEEFYPTAGRVDIVGIDYYPSSAGKFVSTMQSLHDYAANKGAKFAIGETGLSQTSDITARLAYVTEITSDATLAALPNFIGCTWFNFLKGGVDFRLVDGASSSDTQATVSFLAA